MHKEAKASKQERENNKDKAKKRFICTSYPKIRRRKEKIGPQKTIPYVAVATKNRNSL